MDPLEDDMEQFENVAGIRKALARPGVPGDGSLQIGALDTPIYAAGETIARLVVETDYFRANLTIRVKTYPIARADGSWKSVESNAKTVAWDITQPEFSQIVFRLLGDAEGRAAAIREATYQTPQRRDIQAIWAEATRSGSHSTRAL